MALHMARPRACAHSLSNKDRVHIAMQRLGIPLPSSAPALTGLPQASYPLELYVLAVRWLSKQNFQRRSTSKDDPERPDQ